MLLHVIHQAVYLKSKLAFMNLLRTLWIITYCKNHCGIQLANGNLITLLLGYRVHRCFPRFLENLFLWIWLQAYLSENLRIDSGKYVLSALLESPGCTRWDETGSTTLQVKYGSIYVTPFRAPQNNHWQVQKRVKLTKGTRQFWMQSMKILMEAINSAQASISEFFKGWDQDNVCARSK